MSRSRDLGTRCETAVVRAAVDAGLPAHRTALAGGADVGDVWINHGQVVVQCKGGKAAEQASQALCAAWWAETEAQAERVAQCSLAVLVVKRKRVGKARGWRAFARLDELAWLLDGSVPTQTVVELPYGQLLDLLTGGGS